VNDWTIEIRYSSLAATCYPVEFVCGDSQFALKVGGDEGVRWRGQGK
jgi:hypothetical protein